MKMYFKQRSRIWLTKIVFVYFLHCTQGYLFERLLERKNNFLVVRIIAFFVV